MKISGFTFIKNASKFGYPVKESILSVLPIVDEFIVLVGKSDDNTLDIMQTLAEKEPKIKIFQSIWDTDKFKGATIYAQQTDMAKNLCSGDWLFYLQGDELVHEKFLPQIKQACQKHLKNERVEGFVFNYTHFWGNYDYYSRAHSSYPKEIRIIRNSKHIHSFRDAQSFRFHNTQEDILSDYNSKKDNRKLRCKLLDAEIYHYGWARDPQYMQAKDSMAYKLYRNIKQDGEEHKSVSFYDYGDLNKYPSVRFKGTHPKVLDNFKAQYNWQDYLFLSKRRMPMSRKRLFITFIERFFCGKFSRLGGFKNFSKI